MSDLQAAPTAAPNPPVQARAARLEKFQREQAIVEYLNRGVSVVEIAARVGVGEKRMRAIIREILARRMPGPPMEFVAIQTSRLNEALLVAYSAMSPTNLGAVDRVIRIVRELDRYRGFCAAERRPEASSGLAARRSTRPPESPLSPNLRSKSPKTRMRTRIWRTWTLPPTPSPAKARNRRRLRPNLPRRRAQSGKRRNGPTAAPETPTPSLRGAKRRSNPCRRCALRHGLLRLRLAMTTLGEPSLAVTVARESRRKSLKTFNLRPDLSGPCPNRRPSRTGVRGRPATEAAPRGFFAESREGRLLERDRRRARNASRRADGRPGRGRGLGAARSGGRRPPGKSGAKP